jgi:uncharacterized protein YkwD
MVGRGLWGVAAGIAASCALALALRGPPGSAPPATAATAAGSPLRETPAASVSAGPVASTGAKRAAPEVGKRSPASLDALEAEVLERVNRHRRAAGLRALRADPRIAEIARAHSRAMASGRRGFGHGDFEERSEAVEVRVARYRRVAENVAHHGPRRGDLPGQAVAGWLRSSGHRRNIEGPYSLTGVGAAVSGRGEVYLTQIFVAPR